MQRTSTNPVHILVVEDCEDILFIMKTELEWLGYSVDGATDGMTGLFLARTRPPDLVISDIRMPGMDGLEFIGRIRQISGLHSIPAIALTGFGMDSDIREVLAGGFTAHLMKP